MFRFRYADVDAQEAKTHPLYGIRGFLIVLAAYLIFLAISGLSRILVAIEYSNNPIGVDGTIEIIITEIVFVFLYIIALIFLFWKSRKFASVIIATMSLQCLGVVASIANVFLDDDIPYEIYVDTFKNDHFFGFWQFHFGHLAIPIFLIFYVLMSKRVNVTFRSRVRSETS